MKPASMFDIVREFTSGARHTKDLDLIDLQKRGQLQWGVQRRMSTSLTRTTHEFSNYDAAYASALMEAAEGNGHSVVICTWCPDEENFPQSTIEVWRRVVTAHRGPVEFTDHRSFTVRRSA